MGHVADSWLVEVDRQALPSFLRSLAGTGVAASPELGEATRRLTFPSPVTADVVTSSGLVRFALAIRWEGTESDYARAFPARPGRVHALRRHDRFAAERLAARPGPSSTHDVAVANGRLLLGDAAHFLPRRLAPPASLPSRAGEKIAEALDLLTERGLAPPAEAHWLELGAFPGGMTTELSRRGYRVTALDVAPATDAMRALRGVTCVTASAEDFDVEEDFDALLSDVNGSPGRAARAVTRLATALRPGGLVVHTLKLPCWDDSARLVAEVRTHFATGGLTPLGVQHLRQNRQEVTLFARKGAHGDLRDR